MKKQSCLLVGIVVVSIILGLVIGLNLHHSITTIPSINTQTVNINTQDTGKININTATEKELASLDGIGDIKAKTIIEYRSAHLLTCLEDLLNIKGIGKSTIAKIGKEVSF